MATQITITKIDYANPPASSQQWTIEYKLFSDVDYILVSNTVTVNPDGTLTTPLDIPGLTPGSLYYVRASANCESPAVYYYQQIRT